jgi:hypothetical protein
MPQAFWAKFAQNTSTGVTGASVRLRLLSDQHPLVASQRLAKTLTASRRIYCKEQIESVLGVFCSKRLLLFSAFVVIIFCKPNGLRPADAGQFLGTSGRLRQ